MKYLSMRHAMAWASNGNLHCFVDLAFAGVPPPRIPTREKGNRIEIMVYQEYFWVSLGPVSRA
jgi:hypothetical protein